MPLQRTLDPAKLHSHTKKLMTSFTGRRNSHLVQAASRITFLCIRLAIAYRRASARPATQAVNPPGLARRSRRAKGKIWVMP